MTLDPLAEAQKNSTQPALASRVSTWFRHLGHAGWYLLAAAAAILMTLALIPWREELDILSIGLLFLLLTFAVALTGGSGPAILAAFCSFLLFDFFLIRPYHRFAINQRDHLFALVVFLGIGIATGQLVARVRNRTAAAEREQHRSALLLELNQALISNISLDDLLATIVERVVRVFGASGSRIMLPVGDELAVRMSYPPTLTDTMNRAEQALAEWTFQRHQTSAMGQRTGRIRLPHGSRNPGEPHQETSRRPILFIPLVSGERGIGVLEMEKEPGSSGVSPDEIEVLTSFANGAVLAIERVRLKEEAARAEVLAQSDALKSALLAGVSHDLRTPLATIKTSVTALMDRAMQWDDASRQEFLESIDGETDRLTLMIANLLDLSRIQGGALIPDRDWYDVKELLTDVVSRLRSRDPQHQIELQIEDDLPLIWLDYVEIVQVLMNLGENALKYTPSDSRITFSIQRSGNMAQFSVTDDGTGVPPAARYRIFEAYYRANPDGPIMGSGIGLAISKGLVEAHGGKIWVDPATPHGSIFRFTIPLMEAYQP